MERKTPILVWRLLQDLVHADSECLVLVVFQYEIFINPELCRCDSLALWNTGKVKSKFSSVLLVQKRLILTNYQEEKIRESNRQVVNQHLIDALMCLIKMLFLSV